MQGLHHQQQLASLLSAVLPKDDSAEDESSRLAALSSLHRAILFPPNSLLISHSASFLSQGFSQLLSDQSYSVRRTTAIAYGALCAVVCSGRLASNGQQSHSIAVSVVDQFIAWALPLLRDIDVGDETNELALEALMEFLGIGDGVGIEGYTLPILKACQELLEDERTSLSLLRQLLSLLTLISLKFDRCFQPHFVDIIDLLLGWALMPDLSESDRNIIMHSFLQFQKHWLNNLQFSLGLLSKFLGDMEVLLQDSSMGTPKQLRRLLALLSCFSTILQVTASGMLEMNLLEQIQEPLTGMLPQFLACLSVVSKKFGWSKWVGDFWGCLLLLSEILCEKLGPFYSDVTDILFQCLQEDSASPNVELRKVSSSQVHGVLKTNLQLLSLQKFGLLPLSVQKLLLLNSPLSQLRLHPNHLVTGCVAATYLFVLQHECDRIVGQAISSMLDELSLLKGMVGKQCKPASNVRDNSDQDLSNGEVHTDVELVALFKFDLKMLLVCACSSTSGKILDQGDFAISRHERSVKLASFILEKLNPFELPIQGNIDLQVHVLRTLQKLSEVELLSKVGMNEISWEMHSPSAFTDSGKRNSFVIAEYLRKYSAHVVRALDVSSPLSVKVEALEWIRSICTSVASINREMISPKFTREAMRNVTISSTLLLSVLDASSDRELKVRFHVGAVLELLLLSGLIHPGNFYHFTEAVLERIGDVEAAIKNSYVRLLAIAMPVTIYTCGALDNVIGIPHAYSIMGSANRPHMHWKQVFALKQLPRQFHSQLLVSVLSYISQRWKIPLESWIQRLVFSCHATKDFVCNQSEEMGSLSASGLWMDLNIDGNALEKICSVSNLAAVWWAIQEAARYCVSVRLRTNLGGPTQTFAALERMLLDIAHVLQVDNEQIEGNVTIVGSSSVHLLPMRLLLDFVEALKKNVYNAYDGSTVLPCAPRQSSLFFRANKKVCEEWFARMCEPMMNAGLALQCHSAMVHYCTLRLQDFRNLVVSSLKDKSRTQIADNLQNLRTRIAGDVLRILRHMSLALCRSHEPEALVGLQKWVTITFSPLFVEDNLLIPGHTGPLGLFSWISGLVYQAHSQYEKAAAHFSQLLQTEEILSSMGSEGIQFAIARVIESYAAISDWKSLETWLLELQALRAKHAGRSYSGALTTAGNEMNAIHALARFDEGDTQAAWGYLDLTPKSSNELTLNPRLALQRSEQMLLQAMLNWDGKLDKVSGDIEKAKLMLEEALSVVPLDGLAEAAAFATQLHCIFAFEEVVKTDGQGDMKRTPTLLSSLPHVLESPMNIVNQDCAPWLKILRVHQTIRPNSPITLELSQKLIGLARKQKNFMMAHRLHQYLKKHIVSCAEGDYVNLLTKHLQYEDILLLYAEDKQEDALMKLWLMVHSYMQSPMEMFSDNDRMLKAKASLKLATWLRRGSSSRNLENILSMMSEHFKELKPSSSSSLTNNNYLTSNMNSGLIVEEVIGIATKLSSVICPTMGKAWLSYASWCYSQAQGCLSSADSALRECTLSPVLLPELPSDRFQLTEEERSRVEVTILKLFDSYEDLKDAGEEQIIWGGSSENFKKESTLKALVQRAVYLIEAAAGAPGVESSGGESPSSRLTSELQMSFLHVNAGLEKANFSSSIDELVDIWWSLRQRRVSLFGCAAQGYLQFLSLVSSRFQGSQGTSSNLQSTKQIAGNGTLRATLYVLHILLNYGVELRDTLEPGLATVPLLPWQEITPQLFARLSSHPEKVVRKQVEGLLMMLAKLSPWSIVYPTLVDVNAYEGDPSEELQHIISCLEKLYPKLVQDVQLLINELGAMTVLWEEQWLSTLQDLHSDVMRRINVLKEEAARIADNITLSNSEKSKINSAKYSAMMAPIVVALERRLASTSRKPETAHEIWFQEEYGEQLKLAISTFKTPPVSAAALGDVWRPFAAIAASLAAHQRKSTISLHDVAPQLSQLSSTDVPMPGLEKQISVLDPAGGPTADLQGIVTISSFCDQVSILSTKTKPKKLVILGSDGRKYTYLLKGREDLRLDARIMQLLQAVNEFLCAYADTRSHCLVRYYSVTPISGRAGLIQWVDNVISIYSIFKSWQNRVQLAQLSTMGTGNVNNAAIPPVPRPSDMFYGKIIPALKEKGIRRVISRRDWPHEVKRKVLLELMKETPRHLLLQEIWCASEGFKAFSSKMKRFSGSVAAMSMVGHILGLGDRHLDNILIDFHSGDVVHIDYNVCFDKGQRLKIPEIVPFRLTQMIETALGLTGIEGTYRANCETVLGVLRKNKDIILMLLEVFVWDPLVEWTRGDSHDEAVVGGEERKGMELAVSLSLFASRVQEIRVPLQEHQDLLLSTIPATESALEGFLDVLNQYEVVSALFYRADQERANLLIHETSAKSIVAEATNNSEKTRTSFEVQAREFAQAKASTAEKAQEAAIWIEQHGRVLDALRGGSIPEVQALLDLSSTGESFSLTSAVMVAGVPLTVVPEPTQAHCHDLDREVSQLVMELDGGISCAITALRAYALALQRILPLNYITSSPVHGWAQVLQQSVSNLSSDALALARRQAADLIAKVQGNDLDTIRQRYEDLCLNMENYAMNIQKVEAECSELVSSIGSDTEAKSKDRLLSAFTKYMQSTGYSSKEDEGSKDLKGDFEEKKVKMVSVLYIAVAAMYDEVKRKVLDISCNASHQIGWMSEEDNLNSGLGISFGDLEGQIEKCALISGFINELQQLIGVDLANMVTEPGMKRYPPQGNWASVFQASIVSCRILIGQMMEVVLPEVIRLVVSCNSEVMDAFGSLSQIRGSIDTALEQLVEIELERASLLELEQNYFVKVGRITEQQLALEEAASKGRDHLSWEEAEELATQEEACRAQLDQLHQTWNQKDMHTTSLTRRETNIKNALVSAERRFSSLISVEQGSDLHVMRSKALLATLAKPFSELESIEQALSSFVNNASYELTAHNLADMMTSGYSLSELIWKFASLLNNHSFFIWKISIVDSFLDSCIHDVSSVDHNLGFDQLYSILKKKLEHQLQQRLGQYLQERVAPALLLRLEKENENLKQLTEATKDFTDQAKRDVGAVKKVQRALEEYCDAHETARAARSTVSQMKRQVNELTETLRKTSLEIVQMEWLHDLSLSYLRKNQAILPKFLGDDKSTPIILNLNRSKLLENLQSAMTTIAKSVEGLQACERTSISAEGQLERAMGWACAGPSTSNASAKNSGIPSEFHDHLMRRRQLLWAAKEQASDIMKICTSVMEFEASRDGLFRIPGEISSGRNPSDGRIWQQAYLSILTRLDVAYHSFTCAEQEWKLAQSSLEAATNSLFSATSELCVASVKAKTASGDLQGVLSAMQKHAYESNLALSAFGRVTRGHTALTSECGSMLEEVLAITKGLHDVYSLGKDAAAMHAALMEDLSKASMILLPVESMLSKDVAAMEDAISRERESEMEISPIHGQALYRSYCLRLREVCQALKPLVPSLTYSVKELHALVTRLARTASIHAGNLHKALEGLGDSEVVSSQEIALSRSELADDVVLFDKENPFFSGGNETRCGELKCVDRFSSQEEWWISPPDSIYSSSTQSSVTSTGESTTDNSRSYTNFREWVYVDGGEEALQISKLTLSSNSDVHQSSLAENLHDHNMKDGNGGGISDGVVAYDPSKHFQGSSLSNEGGDFSKLSHYEPKAVLEEVNLSDSKNEVFSSNNTKGQGLNHNAHTDPVTRTPRGKNAYALSVLRRVEMKLDGRDIEETRETAISEQVDHLLKQATSIDNLCNMYEGWTPWI